MHGTVPDATLSVPLRFLLGVVGGVVATLAMDVVMERLPEGETPPLVASGVLTESSPDGAPQRLATVVHYLAGALTGPLFVWLLFLAEGLLGRSLVVTAIAAIVCLGLMVGFFVLVVLPRSRLAAQRLGTIRRDWTLSAAAYLLVLVPIVTLGTELL